jgi:hypothetical protein
VKSNAFIEYESSVLIDRLCAAVGPNFTSLNISSFYMKTVGDGSKVAQEYFSRINRNLQSNHPVCICAVVSAWLRPIGFTPHHTCRASVFQGNLPHIHHLKSPLLLQAYALVPPPSAGDYFIPTLFCRQAFKKPKRTYLTLCGIVWSDPPPPSGQH